MMIEARLLVADEMDEAKKLACRVFGNSEMGEAFPHLFSSSLQQCFGVFDDGQLVSFMGLVPNIIRIGASRISIYSLGTVCTHEEYRGRGHASMLVKQSIQHAREAGASLLLVSGELPLYQREGCYPYGEVERFEIHHNAVDLLPELPDQVQFREFAATDWLKLHACASSREVAYEHSVWDLALLLEAQAWGRCNNVRHKVVVAEEDGELLAFAVLGLPLEHTVDAPAALIEWGGDEGLAASIIKRAMQRYDIPLLHADLPWHEKQLSRVISAMPHAKVHTESTIKLMNPSKLLTELREFWMEQAPGIADQLWVETLEDGNFMLKLGEQQAMLTDKELTALLFNPHAQLKLDEHMQHSLQQLFPVPLPNEFGLNYV